LQVDTQLRVVVLDPGVDAFELDLTCVLARCGQGDSEADPRPRRDVRHAADEEAATLEIDLLHRAELARIGDLRSARGRQHGETVGAHRQLERDRRLLAFPARERQRVLEAQVLAPGVERPPEADAAVALVDRVLEACEGCVEVAGAFRELRLEGSPALARALVDDDHPPARVAQAVDLLDRQAIGDPLELDDHLGHPDAARIARGIAHVDDHVGLGLALFEHHPRAEEGNLAVARAHQVGRLRIVRDSLEDEDALRVGERVCHARLAARRQAVQRYRDARGVLGAVGVDDAPTDAARSFGQRARSGLRERARGAGHRQREPGGALRPAAAGPLPALAAHQASRARVAAGHITAMLPSVKMASPIHSQLTSGFLYSLSVADPSGSIAVRIT
jgi:hypothetical protein